MPFSASEILYREYGDSRNFMTPKVLRVGKLSPHMAYELSTGTGIGGGDIYGVSVVSIDDKGHTRRESDLSKCFPTRAQAEEYIEKLSKGGVSSVPAIGS